MAIVAPNNPTYVAPEDARPGDLFVAAEQGLFLSLQGGRGFLKLADYGSDRIEPRLVGAPPSEPWFRLDGVVSIGYGDGDAGARAHLWPDVERAASASSGDLLLTGTGAAVYFGNIEAPSGAIDLGNGTRIVGRTLHDLLLTCVILKGWSLWWNPLGKTDCDEILIGARAHDQAKASSGPRRLEIADPAVGAVPRAAG
jgi:hypothetical protein